jgi:hypothetical protein
MAALRTEVVQTVAFQVQTVAFQMEARRMAVPMAGWSSPSRTPAVGRSMERKTADPRRSVESLPTEAATSGSLAERKGFSS